LTEKNGQGLVQVFTGNGKGKTTAALGTVTVVFAAAYLLWALKRMLYGPIAKPENEALTDLTRREYLVLAPLLVVILWLGLFPGPVLRRMQPSSERFIELVRLRAPAAQAAHGPILIVR